MLAMVASRTTISWAMEISTRAQPRCCLRSGVDAGSRSSVVDSDMGFLSVVSGGAERGGPSGPESGREDDLVDDPGDRVLVGRVPHEEEPVEHDPRERGG